MTASRLLFLGAVSIASVVANIDLSYKYYFGDIGNISLEDADEAFASKSWGSGDVADVEKSLREVFTTLPKNDLGLLSHSAAKRALHNFFSRRHGWYITGIEPGSEDASVPETQELMKMTTHWIPAHLMSEQLAASGKNGFDLEDLEALAMGIYSLAKKEIEHRIVEIYRILELTVGPLALDDATDVLLFGSLVFFFASNIDVDTRASWDRVKGRPNLPNWPEMKSWVLSLAKSHGFGKDITEVDDIVSILVAVQENYFELNRKECHDLKLALMGFSDRSMKAGRVRLPDFYKHSLYSHWNFKESVEYLRDLGALDDSDASIPAGVIIPNYVVARSNCLQGSKMFAVCCQMECDDLMTHLERDIAGASATSDRIAAFVEGLSTDTVKAPWTLSSRLRQRLNQIAESSSNGEVQIHGRLFAQWMHHVFPFECPYPHEVLKPLSPYEWTQETKAESHEISDDEFQKHINDDSCPAQLPASTPCDLAPDADPNAEVELPWSDVEVLLHVSDDTESTAGLSWSRVCVAVCLLAIAGCVHLKTRHAVPSDRAAGVRTPVIVCLVCAAAFLVNMVDLVMFMFCEIGGAALLAVRLSDRSRYAVAKKIEPDSV